MRPAWAGHNGSESSRACSIVWGHLLRGAERIGRIEACAEEMIFNTEAGSHGAASSLW
jgi:hypothetical protein